MNNLLTDVRTQMNAITNHNRLQHADPFQSVVQRPLAILREQAGVFEEMGQQGDHVKAVNQRPSIRPVLCVLGFAVSRRAPASYLTKHVDLRLIDEHPIADAKLVTQAISGFGQQKRSTFYSCIQSVSPYLSQTRGADAIQRLAARTTSHAGIGRRMFRPIDSGRLIPDFGREVSPVPGDVVRQIWTHQDVAAQARLGRFFGQVADFSRVGSQPRARCL